MATASVAPSYRSSFDCWSGISPDQLAADVRGEGMQQQRRYSLQLDSLSVQPSGPSLTESLGGGSSSCTGLNDELQAALETAELVAAMQYQQRALLLQQAVAGAAAEEHNIDAQIHTLLQLKQQLRLNQHTAATGHHQQHQHLTSVAEEALAPGPVDASSSALFASSASLASPLPAANGPLLTDLTDTWADLAAAPGVQPGTRARHSVDLGGLSHRLAAMELSASGAMGLDSLACGSLSFTSAGMPAASMALTVTDYGMAGLPDMGCSVASLAPHLPMPEGLTANTALVLQSALYAPAVVATTAAPLLSPMVPQQLSRQSVDMRRQSMDIRQSMDLGGLVSPQPCMGLGRPSLSLPQAPLMAPDQGMAAAMAAQDAAGWNFAARRASVDVQARASFQQHQLVSAFAVSDVQRASIDVARTRTPEGHAPPHKSMSVLTITSSGCSSRSPPRSGGCNGGAPNKIGRCRRPSMDRAPMQAPKWAAGTNWSPAQMAAAASSGSNAPKGTGVFIPPSMLSTVAAASNDK